VDERLNGLINGEEAGTNGSNLLAGFRGRTDL